jgi:hypothetical protein
MAIIDDYSDLPDWIRPGAKLARLGLSDYSFVTVTKITRTQIVAVEKPDERGFASEYRFDRKPIPADRLTGEGEQWRRRGGAYFEFLKRRDHPEIVNSRVSAIVRNASYQIELEWKTHNTAKRNSSKSPGELAMDYFDAVENITRAARRKVERLTDPGGHLAAEYAAEHAQDLTSQEG